MRTASFKLVIYQKKTQPKHYLVVSAKHEVDV